MHHSHLLNPRPYPAAQAMNTPYKLTRSGRQYSPEWDMGLNWYRKFITPDKLVAEVRALQAVTAYVVEHKDAATRAREEREEAELEAFCLPTRK